jgi:thioredoxin reductase (NADPH)
MRNQPESVYDLLIIGGGFSGLAAAMHAAMDGLTTAVLEASDHFGGQGGTSAWIENYPGFAEGVSGPALTAQAVQQATKLGATLTLSSPVTEARRDEGIWVVTHGDGKQIQARALLLATGLRPRRLDIPGEDHLIYGARPETLDGLLQGPVAIIGAANAAGTAALELAKRLPVIIIARDTLAESMSDRVVTQIREQSNIRVVEHADVREVIAKAESSGSTLRLSTSDELEVAAALAFVGFVPAPCSFITECEATTDKDGYVVTVPDGFAAVGVPGLFAAGDIRAGSRKRIIAAAGEGGAAAAEIWRFVRKAMMQTGVRLLRRILDTDTGVKLRLLIGAREFDASCQKALDGSWHVSLLPVLGDHPVVRVAITSPTPIDVELTIADMEAMVLSLATSMAPRLRSEPQS